MFALIASALTDQIAATAAIVAAVVAFSVLMGKIHRMIKRIDEAIGVDKQGRTLADRLEKVEHQLWPNGGSSLMDKVEKIRLRQIVWMAIMHKHGWELNDEENEDDE